MMRRMITAAMLTTAVTISCFVLPTFAQDQSGQSMQSENKMADSMMKNGDNMMKAHKKTTRRHRKNTHKKSTNSHNMKGGDRNVM